MNGSTPADSPNEAIWIGPEEIRSIPGALKPAAYAGRAYLHAKEHSGTMPLWARKNASGQWVFSRAYIEADARDHCRFIGVSEAASVAGVTRRTIQNWIDAGEIPTSEPRDPGQPRRIPREDFLERLPTLKRATSLTRQASSPPPPQLQEEYSRLRSAEKERVRIAQAKVEAEHTLKALTEKEQRLLSDLQRIKSDYDERLHRAEDTLKAILKDRKSVESRLKETVTRETSAADEVNGIMSAIASRLKELAQRVVSGSPPRPPPAPRPAPIVPDARVADQRRTRATAIAKQISDAHHEKAEELALRHKAEQMAARLADDVEEGKISMGDALNFYQTLAARNGIPDAIRRDVQKHYLKRRTWSL